MGTATKKKTSVRTKKIEKTAVKKTAVIGLCLFIILTVALRFEYIAEIIPVSRMLDGVYPLSESSTVFEPFKGCMLVADKNGVTSVDKSGNEKWHIPEILDIPIISVKGNEAAAAASGGNVIYRIKGNGKYSRIDTEYPVLNLKASDGGYLLAVMDRKMYNGGVTVFGRNNDIIMSWWAGENRLCDAALSGNGKYLAVSCLKTSGNKISSEIIYFNLKKDGENYTKISFENEMISGLEWVSESRLLAVSEKTVYALNVNGDEKWSFSFDGGVINSFNAENADNLVFVSGGNAYDKNSRVVSLKANGHVNGDFSLEEGINGISANKSTILFNTQEGVRLVQKSGRRLRANNYEGKPIKAELFKTGNRVFADFGNEVRLFYCGSDARKGEKNGT